MLLSYLNMNEDNSVKCFPWYFSNDNHQKDLTIPTFNQSEKLYYFKFHTNLNRHSNPLIKRLSYLYHISR